jgi:hypothetical protein
MKKGARPRPSAVRLTASAVCDVSTIAGGDASHAIGSSAKELAAEAFEGIATNDSNGDVS